MYMGRGVNMFVFETSCASVWDAVWITEKESLVCVFVCVVGCQGVFFLLVCVCIWLSVDVCL